MVEDQLAPFTGWSRRRWAGLADRMLLAVRACASDDHAQIVPPGPHGAFGRDVDGLEGFARTFLLAGFRLAGEGGQDPLGLAQWYSEGLAHGTDPDNSGRWVRPDESGQAKVEAASVALILDMTRPWIWDRLDDRVQQQVVSYLAVVVGDDAYPHNNWRWFRVIVQTFLRSVDGPWSREEIETDLAFHDSFQRPDGWIADGPLRAFDHYGGWALHLYPALWARMSAAEDLAADRLERDRDRLDRYLLDAVRLIGGDGSPLFQGRSLIYRFAAAAPFWVGAISRVPSLSSGVLRRAASGVMAHFAPHLGQEGAASALLSVGWHGSWPAMAQHYSGPSSPYWAVKGMLGLSLPPTDPVWTSREEPLPLELSDQLFTIRAPGWLVSGTKADGIVRVINHGTDYGRAGLQAGDAPNYAEFGYSTVTSPRMTAAARTDPVEQSVVLLDPSGRSTHRTGFTTGTIGLSHVGAEVAVGSSVARAHWLTEASEYLDYGPGASGEAVDAAALRTVSVLRGPWEIRLVRIEELPENLSPITGMTLRLGGWAVSGDEPTYQWSNGADVRAGALLGGLRSLVFGAAGFDTAGVRREHDVSPLGGTTLTPWLTAPVTPHQWFAAMLCLDRQTPTRVDARSTLSVPRIALTANAEQLWIRWGEGVESTVELSGLMKTETL
ncbi:DUF2264 domain-containing protein [Tessaracoccus antarcticus]|uniref:DUF2264 domain-containing protein n=1 Tax=Tessaracoccus antarcticus TaxID=2479848 RepID=A0A3M0G0Q9_9ACTN|nr:DUF2264 domain-containing protein [Tessaracoccus antarcticus]RMB57777.1 DUF2264 domain-containing protein [Tessaracoccus antarcticus]